MSSAGAGSVYYCLSLTATPPTPPPSFPTLPRQRLIDTYHRESRGFVGGTAGTGGGDGLPSLALWIPALSGMTAGVDFRVSPSHRLLLRLLKPQRRWP